MELPDTIDPDFATIAWKASQDLGNYFHPAPGHEWRGYIVKTTRATWLYEYSVRRNMAGWFLGRVVIYDRDGQRISTKPTKYFKRRVKQRVIEIQRERALKHRARIIRKRRRK